MKKIVYVFAIAMMGFSAQANHMSSELILDAYGNTLITVGLDNQFYNRPDYKYRITDVEPGTHYLQVMTNSYNPYYPNPYGQVIFSGYVNIPVRSKISAKIDRFGKYKVLNIVPLCPAPVVYNVPPPCPPPAPYYMPMSNYDFDNLRQSIDSKSFESTRMEIAKQVVSQRYVSTLQVKELMDLLTFESSKLELAKFAFDKTVDKENYFRVNDAFTFESSIRELDDYIKDKS
ncbi:MAG: DUF4476 domain-containing protein [Bacteroidia bacterium]